MVPEREGYIFKGWASSAEASVGRARRSRCRWRAQQDPGMHLGKGDVLTFNAMQADEAAIRTVITVPEQRPATTSTVGS